MHSLANWFRRHQRRLGDAAPYLQVVFLTIAITAVGTVVVLNVPWLPEEASTQAGPVDTLYNLLAVASVFVFALVISILFVSVVRFRRRFGDESDGKPIHGHTGLEILWTAIPSVIRSLPRSRAGSCWPTSRPRPGPWRSPASSSLGPSHIETRASGVRESCTW